MSSEDKTMKALNTLRRLPENRVCGTCRCEDRLGFSAVCVKYQIFVCGDCKSAHQAYSHRCKSVTMSNWTADEVDALREDRGGGNAYNRKKTFAQLPPASSSWPRKGCHPDERKAFVLNAYSDRNWESDEPPPIIGAVAPAVQKMVTAPASTEAPSTAAPSTFDLLLANDAEPAKTSWSAFEEAAPAVKDRAESAPNAGILEWGAFDAAPPPAAPDSFSDFFSSPSASPAAATPLAATPFAATPLAAAPSAAASPLASKLAEFDFFAAPPTTPPSATQPSTPLSALNVGKASPSEKAFSATIPAGAASMPPMPTRPFHGPPAGMGRMPGGGMPPQPPPMAGLAAQMPAGAMSGMPMPRMPAGMPGGMGRMPAGGMHGLAGLAAQMPMGAMAGMPMPGMPHARGPMQCGA